MSILIPTRINLLNNLIKSTNLNLTQPNFEIKWTIKIIERIRNSYNKQQDFFWNFSIVNPLNYFGLGGFLRAVPKKKVSHSRKAMRSAHKGLKPNLSLGVCPACGEPKRQHFLCLHCYADNFFENRGKTNRTPWEKGITP